jgi:hypothetical protein
MEIEKGEEKFGEFLEVPTKRMQRHWRKNTLNIYSMLSKTKI